MIHHQLLVASRIVRFDKRPKSHWVRCYDRRFRTPIFHGDGPDGIRERRGFWMDPLKIVRVGDQKGLTALQVYPDLDNDLGQNTKPVLEKGQHEERIVRKAG
jgi:hypothetical protein